MKTRVEWKTLFFASKWGNSPEKMAGRFLTKWCATKIFSSKHCWYAYKLRYVQSHLCDIYRKTYFRLFCPPPPPQKTAVFFWGGGIGPLYCRFTDVWFNMSWKIDDQKTYLILGSQIQDLRLEVKPQPLAPLVGIQSPSKCVLQNFWWLVIGD